MKIQGNRWLVLVLGLVGTVADAQAGYEGYECETDEGEVRLSFETNPFFGETVSWTDAGRHYEAELFAPVYEKVSALYSRKEYLLGSFLRNPGEAALTVTTRLRNCGRGSCEELGPVKSFVATLDFNEKVTRFVCSQTDHP